MADFPLWTDEIDPEVVGSKYISPLPAGVISTAQKNCEIHCELHRLWNTGLATAQNPTSVSTFQALTTAFCEDHKQEDSKPTLFQLWRY